MNGSKMIPGGTIQNKGGNAFIKLTKVIWMALRRMNDGTCRLY